MMPIRRTIKNVVKNYTFAELKVREATCNDQWGPNTKLMNEIADLTDSSLARGQIMNMIWKRLSDTGKNWRHVIKGLSLLEYLAKVGSPQVAELCKCHIHLINILNDFQFYENGVDYGAAIRDKSKNFVNLLRDSERFKNERQKALATKDRLAHSTGLGSTGGKLSNSVSDRYLSTSDRFGGSERHIAALSPELEAVRPSSFGEEDLQLQLALAMSKEQHSEELKKRKGDDMKLKMAIEESRKTSKEVESATESFDQALSLGSTPKASYPFLPPPSQQSASKPLKGWNDSNPLSSQDPFNPPSNQDPFNPSGNQDPFNPSNAPSNATPWSPVSSQSDPFVPSTANGQSYADNLNSHPNPFVPNATNQSQPSKDPWAPLDAFAQPIAAVDPFQSKSPQQTFGQNNSNFSPSQQPPQQQESQQPLVPHQPPLQPQQPPVDLDNEFDMLVYRGKEADNSENDLLGVLGGDFLSKPSKRREKKGEEEEKEEQEEEEENGGGKSKDLVSDFLGENAKLVDLSQLITKPPTSTLTNPFSMTPYNPASATASTQPNYNLLIPNLPNDPFSQPQPIPQNPLFIPPTQHFAASTTSAPSINPFL